MRHYYMQIPQNRQRRVNSLQAQNQYRQQVVCCCGNTNGNFKVNKLAKANLSRYVDEQNRVHKINIRQFIKDKDPQMLEDLKRFDINPYGRATSIADRFTAVLIELGCKPPTRAMYNMHNWNRAAELLNEQNKFFEQPSSYDDRLLKKYEDRIKFDAGDIIVRRTNNIAKRTNWAQSSKKFRSQHGPDDVAVSWCGTSSGSPSLNRNVSCTAVRMRGETFIIDAGENCLPNLDRAGVDLASISNIFITHMHGDHCFGLATLLVDITRARHAAGLTGAVQLVGPLGLASFLHKHFQTTQAPLYVPVSVHELARDLHHQVRPKRPSRRASKQERAAIIRQYLKVLNNPTPELQSGISPSAPPLEAYPHLSFHILHSDQYHQVVRHVKTFEQVQDSISVVNCDDKYQRALEDPDSQFVPVVRGMTWTMRTSCGVVVTAAQLRHRVPTWGYVIQEPHAVVQLGNGDVAGEKSGSEAQVSDTASPQSSQQGASPKVLQWFSKVLLDQKTVQKVHSQGYGVRKGRKVVILGDTCDSSALAVPAMHADLLSHEATFQSIENELAAFAMHSTSQDAGLFAKRIGARRLVLTHFSARYTENQGDQDAMAADPTESLARELDDTRPLVDEARAAMGSNMVIGAYDCYTCKIDAHKVIGPRKMGITATGGQ